MLYLVGGAARSGKSTLAMILHERKGVPWFCLDALASGLAQGVPGWPRNLTKRDLDRVWDVIRPMLDVILWDGRPYLVEGVVLPAARVAQYVDSRGGRVRACFLGYAEADATSKRAAILLDQGGTRDWLRDRPEHTIDDTIRVHIGYSAWIKSACATTGLKYFDTFGDFSGTLEAAAAYLTLEPEQS